MKLVIIIAIAFVLLIPVSVLAQLTPSEFQSSDEIEPVCGTGTIEKNGQCVVDPKLTINSEPTEKNEASDVFSLYDGHYDNFEKQELNNLKKLLPDYYNIDKNLSAIDDNQVMITATINTNNELSPDGVISILKYFDEDRMWYDFKQMKMFNTNLEDVENLSATCVEPSKYDYEPVMTCIKNNLWISVSTFYDEPESIMKEILMKTDNGITLSDIDKISSKGGGCLIATATYGSELAPQVQLLRELRDNQLLNTESGTSFMESFNDFYYSFSPYIADYERENPVFREVVKIAITPMIISLSILNYIEMDSEESVLGYGISLILLNIGMYFVVPMIVIMRIRK